LAFSDQGANLWVTFRKAPFLRMWRLADGRPSPGGENPAPSAAVDLPGPAFALAFSPDEELAAIGLYGEIVLVHVPTRAVIARWKAPHGDEQFQGAVHGLSFSPDGGRLASTDITGGIWVWPLPGRP
jgi:hypothetical protein